MRSSYRERTKTASRDTREVSLEPNLSFSPAMISLVRLLAQQAAHDLVTQPAAKEPDRAEPTDTPHS